MATNLTLEDRIRFATQYLLCCLKADAPIRSSNLAQNGIQFIADGQVTVGGEPAPYAVYTNEPWISERWHGKQNPNEGWLKYSIERAKPGIRSIFSGVYSEDDIDAMISDEESTFEDRKKERSEAIRNGGE